MLIFEQSVPGRYAQAQAPSRLDVGASILEDIPPEYRRKKPPRLPEVSELEVVRHYTQLSRKNFSIDTHVYPLGSCTMKYNPRGAHRLASLPGFLGRHPYADLDQSQGFLTCLYELQEILAAVSGMQSTALAPMAGAQGELAGVLMIRAYHRSRGDEGRIEMLISDSAHGTNPASAVMCGYRVREVPTGPHGDIDLEALKACLGPQTAGIMLTNPSTLGIFDRQIKEVARLVHAAGGLLYYDGANLNAVLGQVRPGDMGFDVVHFNLHKTFATPHGGGGPGAGPVVANARLAPFLPIPMVVQIPDPQQGGVRYRWVESADRRESIGRLSTFMGNAGILLRAYIYARMLGAEGMVRVSQYAVLNANYVMKRLNMAGYTLAYPDRRATHEFIVTLKPELKRYQVSAMDVAKRLLDYGFHAPTTYFPLLIPECLLIEPTETESKQSLDQFVDAMISILKECVEAPESVRTAPHTMPVRRLDDVRAARHLNLRYQWGKDLSAPDGVNAPLLEGASG
jgi:glycine dehydrogenase subunit 2